MSKPIAPPTEASEADFWGHLDRRGDCWLWVGRRRGGPATGRRSYGRWTTIAADFGITKQAARDICLRKRMARDRARARRRRWWVHNLIAHPLLVLCPPAGEWLHDRTAPEGDR